VNRDSGQAKIQSGNMQAEESIFSVLIQDYISNISSSFFILGCWGAGVRGRDSGTERPAPLFPQKIQTHRLK
ncbi:MAG: hypothetical protein WC196_06920, partial [Bacilli bacterium]